jgi:acyl-CoA thioesterase-1
VRNTWLVAVMAFAACSKPAPPSAAPAPSDPAVLFLGDSLTAGYGVEPSDAWPSVLEASWRRRGLHWRARNAAVSGDTSAGIPAQIEWALTPEVKVAFLCIGGNDGLRGLSTSALEARLDEAVATLQKRGVRVALAGMRMPPNYGAAYTSAFDAVFPAVARRHRIPFLPFLLDKVALIRGLNQPDNLHPNAEGHKIIAAQVEAFFDREGLLK